MDKSKKVFIVGAGNVGSTCAYTLAQQQVADRIVLFDVNRDKAYAEALDMQHANYFSASNVSITAGDYDQASDADVVIITAAAPTPQDAHNRLDSLRPSMKIMTSIVENLQEVGFSGKIVVVSNPVDVMTYYVWKHSGLPAASVMGSGTTLDSARLCAEIADIVNVKPDDVQALILGEHGDSEIALWSQAQIAGAKADDVIAGNLRETSKEAFHDQLLQKTVEAGWEIFNRKGNTCYGIAASTTAIVQAILDDTKRILPVSVRLDGQLGISNTYLSLPCVLGSDGVEQIIIPDMDQDELERFRHSAGLLNSFYKELD